MQRPNYARRDVWNVGLLLRLLLRSDALGKRRRRAVCEPYM